MTDYAYVGKKGTGKSKHVVMDALQYLRTGLRVATNIDIYLEAAFGPQSRITYIRVPDKPNVFDLEAAGYGQDGEYDEDKLGFFPLDELGTWFNARDFASKTRGPVLEWLALARKKRWNMGYIMQSTNQVDRQLREAFIEITIRHVALQKVRIPGVGWILQRLFGGRAGYLPKMHLYSSRLGTDPNALKTDGGQFMGKHLHKVYDTTQHFSADYPHGTHSVLSPWHVVGRYQSVALPWWKRLLGAVFSSANRPAPVTVVDPRTARVLRLLRALPAEERLRLSARYFRRAAQAPAG